MEEMSIFYSCSTPHSGRGLLVSDAL